jgi:FkbM family methyltransferase
MAVSLDLEWLKSQAGKDADRRQLEKINEWRNSVLETNRFTGSDKLFRVKLGNNKIWFHERSAFSSIEVYQEIFKNNDHFIVPEFSGRNASLIMDIGANEGYYTLKIKENNPACRVICIEPNPYVFEILQRNMRANDLKGVTLVNKAVSSHNGQLNMEIVREIGAISSRDIGMIERPWMREEFKEKISVPAITLDTLCREFNISSIDILKIDVEGMEEEILAASVPLLNDVKRIVLERHSRNLRDAVVSLLQANNFKLVYEEDPLLERYYGDLYFIRNAG